MGTILIIQLRERRLLQVPCTEKVTYFTATAFVKNKTSKEEPGIMQLRATTDIIYFKTTHLLSHRALTRCKIRTDSQNTENSTAERPPT